MSAVIGTDRFGHTILSLGGGWYQRVDQPGLQIQQDTDANALNVFNGMAPDGWTPLAVSQVPASVPMWQLKTVLYLTPSKIGSGQTAFDDTNAVAQQVGGVVWLAWNNADTVHRSSPNINHLAANIGFSEADIDAAFIAAASVTA